MDTSRKEFRYNWIKSLLLSSRFLFSSFLSSLPSSPTPSTSTLTHSWVSRNGYSAHRELLGNRHTAVLRFECRNDEAECSQDAAGYVSCLTVVLCEQTTERSCYAYKCVFGTTHSLLITTEASPLDCYPGSGDSSKTFPIVSADDCKAVCRARDALSFHAH